MKRLFHNILSFSLVIILLVLQNSTKLLAIDRNIELSVLNEDWAKAGDLLVSVDTQTSSPILRLLKAHAYLALNFNNESLCLFSSVASKDELEHWRQWSDSLAAKNPSKAVAHYLKGDALARLKEWDSALMAFNQALELHVDHPLVLNARGVTYAAKHEWDQAVVNFYLALRADSTIADIHASYGALFIQRMEGAEGALRSSIRALEISPDFVLALNTRACAKFILNEWSEAQLDFENAGNKSNCSSIVFANASSSTTLLNEAVSKELTNLTDANPGVTMQNIVRNMSPPDRDRFGKMVTAYRDHSNKALGIIAAIPDNFAIVTPEGKFGYDMNLDSWKNSTRNHVRRYNDILNVIGGPRSYTNRELKTLATGYAKGTMPGGITTSMKHAYIEKGGWPFLIQYGLLYQVYTQYLPENSEQ